MMIVADRDSSLLISGTGDVIDAVDDLIAIGSGGPYAQSAARALFDNTALGAREIVENSLKIAADVCIYTNHSLTIEEIT
jgi:ATP-dependent HslUV protease subunit HslV